MHCVSEHVLLDFRCAGAAKLLGMMSDREVEANVAGLEHDS